MLTFNCGQDVVGIELSLEVKVIETIHRPLAKAVGEMALEKSLLPSDCSAAVTALSAGEYFRLKQEGFKEMSMQGLKIFLAAIVCLTISQASASPFRTDYFKLLTEGLIHE